ncbi:MAG TPA: NAD(P)H-dependent oxidoreductase [Pseudolabrys sp.]|jgi:NAD(P)H-dependent FMN reductase|nr:NAD(P)H-dependent oxidoreductase [Pseudolabrys sp.]
MPNPKILVLPGSVRSGSHNVRLAALAAKELTLLDADVTRISLQDYPLPLYDADLDARGGQPENAVKLKHMIAAHHGVFIASPEYSASVTPILKNAIDWVSRVREKGDPTYAAFKGRVFAIASASPEAAGGLRSLMALRQILELGCGALVIPEQVAIPDAERAFDDMDNLVEARLMNLLRAELARLVDMTRLMM